MEADTFDQETDNFDQEALHKSLCRRDCYGVSHHDNGLPTLHVTTAKRGTIDGPDEAHRQ